MVDPYLLTAPILLLAIIILLRFVGCAFQPGAAAQEVVSLTAEPCNGKVILSWTDSEPPSTYQIHRNNNPLATTNDLSYTDTAVTNGTTYSYTVTASYGGIVNATSNSVSATPAALPGRPPGSTVNTNSPLYQNLIGLFLMNDGQGGQTDGGPADDTNIVDGTPAAHSGATPPTWVLADPSIMFYGGAPLASNLDAGIDHAFDDMPTSQITVLAKIFFNGGAAGGICEKNDSNQGGKDSGFRFAVTSNGALRFIVELSTTNMVIQSGDNAVPVQQPQWVQVAFTWDGTKSTTQNPGPASAAGLYVNGALQPNASETNGVGNLDVSKASNTNPFRIGNADYGPAAGSFHGKMAYMAIYKGRLLSPSDMMALDANLPINYPANLNPCSG
jgi:concanavalin A-like lectin/glucanase superfamily protein